MRAYAIVIGIDLYANPAWGLEAAAEDAVAFARWALDRGHVAQADLRLLLSTDDPPDDLPAEEASRQNIRRAISEVQEGRARDADRLYFYYAGHGLSAPGVLRGGDQEPLLIPADVSDLVNDTELLLGFSRILPVLSTSQPAEQFFFIDACRDFALEDYQPGLGGSVGAWMPPEVEGELSSQLVLYATAPGKRAHERRALRQGVFSGALLAALRGTSAAKWNPIEERYEIRFLRVARQLAATVETNIKRAVGADWANYAQKPQYIVLRSGDAVIATVPDEEVEEVTLTVRVAPSIARRTCRLALGVSAPGRQRTSLRNEGPPVKSPLKLAVPPGDYLLRAEATRYRTYAQACSVWAPTVVDVPLEDAVEDEAGVPEDAPGVLAVTSSDPTVVIAIFDSAGQLKTTGTRRVVADDLPEGVYTVRMMTAAGEPSEETAAVVAGQTTEIRAKPPALERTLGRDQRQMLEGLDVAPDERGYVQPADDVEPIATPSLGLLLALGALAAHAPPTKGLEKLERFGIRGRRTLKKGAGVLVLVGASGDHPAPGITREEFCAGTQVVVRDLEGFLLQHRELRVLRDLPTAAQASLELIPGCVMVELRALGLAPTRYAVTALPGRVSVLIAIAEDSGAVDVQQYLLPVASAELREGEQLGARELRRLELAQRYYVNRASLESLPRQRSALESQADFGELLSGKWQDPLMGALAGYTLLHRERPDHYAGTPAPENMLEYFGGLPDSHVLAGLARPDRRDEHFARALELGVPMFAEGFQALYRWHRERQGHEAWPMLLEPSALLPASPWTAWIAERPVLRVKDGTFGRPPIGWPMLEDRREDIEAALRAVGRLSHSAGHSTSFAVAKGVILAMRSTLSDDGVAGMTVDFGDDPSATPHPFAVTQVEHVIERPGLQSVVLLRTEELATDGTPFPTPLRLAAAPPTSLERRRVYVTGFPTADLSLARDLGVEAAFVDGGDAKRLQPGRVLGLDIDGVTLRHDCLTLRGNGGSPIVDLATGVVLGVHYSSEWSQYKRGNAVPIWDIADVLA